MARELTGRITLKDNYTATMEKVAKCTQKSASSAAALKKAQAGLESAMKSQSAASAKAVQTAENEAKARARAENAAQRMANSQKQLAAAEKMQQEALAEAEGKKGKAAQAALNRADKAGHAASSAAEQVTKWEKEYQRLDSAANQAGEKAASAAEKAASATKSAEDQVRQLQQQLKKEMSPKVKAEEALKKLKPVTEAAKKIGGKAWSFVVAAKDKASSVLKPIMAFHKKIATKAWDLTLKIKDAAGATLKKSLAMLAKLAKGAIITLTVAGVGLAGMGVSMVKGGMELENYEVSMAHFVERTGGGEGGETKAMQQALQSAGLYKGKIDGIVGKQTKAALLAYQKANGLDKTGQADAATIAKLLPQGGNTNAQATTDAYMKWLRNNANVTPFDTGEVIAAGSRAVQIAEGDTTKAQGLVTLAENMAALTPGKTVMDAMEALADAQMGEMERLKEFGMKVGQDEFKEAGGDLFKMKNKNGMGLNQLFEGGAAKLGQTGSGMWSTVTGSAKSAMQEAGREMLEGLKPGIAALIPVIDQLTPHIQSFGRSAGAAIGNAVKWAIAAKSRFSEWANNNKPLIDGIKGALRSFGQMAVVWLGRAVDKTGEIAGAVVDWVANNRPLIDNIKRALMVFGTAMASRIGAVISKIGEIKDGIAEWVNSNRPLIDEIRRKITTFISTASSKISGFVSMIQENMPAIQAAVGGALEVAGSVLSWFWDLWQAAWPNILGFVQTAADYMPTVFKVFRSVFQGIVNALSWLGDLFGIIWPYITGIVSWAVEFIAGAANFIIDHWNVIGPMVMGVAIAFGIVGGAVLALKAAMALYTAVQWLVNASLFACPIFWIIMGIGLLIGAVIALRQNWEEVTTFLEGKLNEFVITAMQRILDLINAMPDWLIDFLGGGTGAVRDYKIALEQDIKDRKGESRAAEGSGRKKTAGAGTEEPKSAPPAVQQAETAGDYTSQAEKFQKQMDQAMDKAMEGMPDLSGKSAFEATSPTAPTYDPMAEYNRQLQLFNGANNPALPAAQATYQPQTAVPTMPEMNTTAPGMDTAVSEAYAQATQTASDAMTGLADAAAKVGTECPNYMQEASTAQQTAATSMTTSTSSAATAMQSSAARMAGSINRAASSLSGAARRISSMASSVVSMMSQARSALSNIKVTVNVSVSGGGNAQVPKLAKGMNYVPSDEFPALLHKGEAVLPRDDASQWRQGKGGGDVTVHNEIQVVRQGHGEDDESFARRLAAIIAQKTEEAKYNLAPNPA